MCTFDKHMLCCFILVDTHNHRVLHNFIMFHIFVTYQGGNNVIKKCVVKMLEECVFAWEVSVCIY